MFFPFSYSKQKYLALKRVVLVPNLAKRAKVQENENPVEDVEASVVAADDAVAVGARAGAESIDVVQPATY